MTVAADTAAAPRDDGRSRAGSGRWARHRDSAARPAYGRIAKLFVGQRDGFIRTVKGREIFFHRGDIHEGTSFNDFAVGDGVAFELVAGSD